MSGPGWHPKVFAIEIVTTDLVPERSHALGIEQRLAQHLHARRRGASGLGLGLGHAGALPAREGLGSVRRALRMLARLLLWLNVRSVGRPARRRGHVFLCVRRRGVPYVRAGVERAAYVQWRSATQQALPPARAFVKSPRNT